MEDQEMDEKSPCKRQRFLQGDEQCDEDDRCILSELRASLVSSEYTAGDPSLSSISQEPCNNLPDDAGDREPEINDRTGDQSVVQSDIKNLSVNQSDNSEQESKCSMDTETVSLATKCNTDKFKARGETEIHDSEVKILSFGEYNLETNEMTEHPVAGKKFKHIRHLMGEVRADSESGNYHGNQTSNECMIAGTSFDTGKQVEAIAENSLIGNLEKMKYVSRSTSPGMPGTPQEQSQVLPSSALPEADNQGGESNPSNIQSVKILPPEYLSDSGFVELFSNDSVNSQGISTTPACSSNSNNNNVHGNSSAKSLFRIKPEYLSKTTDKKISRGTETVQSHVTGKRPNELFNDCGRQSTINGLPSSLLVEIFNNLSPCTLLRRVSSVCKYWYNLSRDPDLWRVMNLRNQHKLTDDTLEQLLNFSERVLHVNLTDCRFLTNQGVRTTLSRCRYIRTLKLMRCFDLTDEAFMGLSLRNLCTQLSALHLDGCYRITDRTVLEVAEACRNLQLLHLNQCNKVTDKGIIAISHNCPRLRQLLLDHCDKVTNAGAIELVQGCPDLVYLNFMSCGVSDDGIRQFSKLKNLANIDLSNIQRLTPGPVMEIARSCQRLECINISLNSVMNDDCVSYIAQHCRQLKRLYCVSCHVTDKGLEDIAKYCPTLEALDVGWCQDVTDNGIIVISLACKKLEYFGLIRCDKVTIDTIEELVPRFPHINYSTFLLESRRLLERARRGFQFGLVSDVKSLG